MALPAPTAQTQLPRVLSICSHFIPAFAASLAAAHVPKVATSVRAPVTVAAPNPEDTVMVNGGGCELELHTAAECPN